MNLQDIEMTIFNCPYTDSPNCDARLRCHPIPGCGSADPKFLVLGINPGKRRGVWCKYDFLEKLKHRYLVECRNPQFSYGRLLRKLEKLVPQFRILETVYLTDIVKCPTRKGLPPDKMIKQCMSAYLEKTIRVLHPDFIICLGKITSKNVGSVFFAGAIELSRIKIADHDCQFIAVPHPSRAEIETIATSIARRIKRPKAVVPVEFDENYTFQHVIKKKELGNMVEEKLLDFGYRNILRNKWVRGDWVVHVVHSSEFGKGYIRIMWREEWKDDHAIVYDYSGVGGPVCVVPVSFLFTSDFVKKKRRKGSYANSKYWWSQRFPVGHELVKLVLSFEGRWNIL